MTNEPILGIRSLDISLPPGADRPFAVKDLTLDLRRNEILCVVGESGSGKSLLATAIMGLLPPGVRIAGGEIDFDGTPLASLSDAQYRKLRGARISMVFQEPMTALNPVLTVREQLDEVLVAHGVSRAGDRQKRILELLNATGLPEPETLQHSYPFRLSGGQRQRVMIAMALALEPDVVIADEPTTALDVTTQKQILELLREIQQRLHIAVLFITHDFGVVAEIADRVAVMQFGELVEEGPAEDVLNTPKHPYTRKLVAAVRGLSDTTTAEGHAGGEPILSIRNATKTFTTGGSGFFSTKRRRVEALKDISVDIGRGETLGLVGESGSGKSTLGQAVVQLLELDSGEIRFHDKPFQAMSRQERARIRPKIQIVFQDPYASLNPRHKIRRALTETQMIHGATRAEALERAEQMLDLVGLDRSALDRFPHEFSGGQRQRIGIARALVMQPDLIVADEAVSALDVSIQTQVLALLADIRNRLNLSMLFITHDLRVAAQVCDRIAVMRRGEIVELGEAGEVLATPRHAYTRQLCDSMPGIAWFSNDPGQEPRGQAHKAEGD
ncbi:ABC transporter ATP-binding protein [Seohaeicola nanhaiensis]|uniref:ABC transporter ATP-binding protein n=1 Tax=Seohaeicola nanhaiensis TaxID=1387282 RepID=A0ABV9KDP2_9RHOB